MENLLRCLDPSTTEGRAQVDTYLKNEFYLECAFDPSTNSGQAKLRLTFTLKLNLSHLMMNLLRRLDLSTTQGRAQVDTYLKNEFYLEYAFDRLRLTFTLKLNLSHLMENLLRHLRSFDWG